MNILFIHQNFPGQFIHLSAELAKNPNNRVVALGMNDRPVPSGVQFRRYSLLRTAHADTHPLLHEQEAHVLRAEACASAAFTLKRDGFEPDIIVAHPGWGEALFIKDVFPRAKLVIYCEYYYALEGQDVGFDPEVAPLNFQQKAKLRLKNTTNLLSLDIADAAISPTRWQKSTYPTWAQSKISVIHDGIDSRRLSYHAGAKVTLSSANGQTEFGRGDEVLTYVARNLEPIRGFHMLMRTLPEVLASRPHAHAIIVGGDDISYGHRPPNGGTWKDHMLGEIGSAMDLTRVHFVGKIPYANYLDLLSISKVHVYWTTPFVLSWSFLEATLSGVPVVASATPPVSEFAVSLGVRTADFFDNGKFAVEIVKELGDVEQRHRQPRHLRELSLEYCLAAQKALLSDVA